MAALLLGLWVVRGPKYLIEFIVYHTTWKGEKLYKGSLLEKRKINVKKNRRARLLGAIGNHQKVACTNRDSSQKDIINYRFLTTETNLKALYIFGCLFTTSSVKLFVAVVR